VEPDFDDLWGATTVFPFSHGSRVRTLVEVSGLKPPTPAYLPNRYLDGARFAEGGTLVNQTDLLAIVAQPPTATFEQVGYAP